MEWEVPDITPTIFDNTVRQTPSSNAETTKTADGHCRVHRERPRYKSRTQLHVQSALASENTPDPCRCQGDRRRQMRTTS